MLKSSWAMEMIALMDCGFAPVATALPFIAGSKGPRNGSGEGRFAVVLQIQIKFSNADDRGVEHRLRTSLVTAFVTLA
jgi:hypothetical protein